MPTWIISLFGGVWGYVAAGVIAAGLATGATHYIDAKAYRLEISNLKLTAANAQTASVTASLNQLQTFISNMKAADANYQSSLDGISSHFATVEKEFKNATVKPLPADCRPDSGRVSALAAAVAAANAHTPVK